MLLLRFHYAGWCFDHPGLICIQYCTEAEFLEEIQTKVLGDFLLEIHKVTSTALT
jgi:hypothetical protein